MDDTIKDIETSLFTSPFLVIHMHTCFWL